MKCFDGKYTLLFERNDNQLMVFLTGTQVNQQELDFMSNKLNIISSDEEGYDFQISYPVSDENKSLKKYTAETKSKLERLQLALKLKNLTVQNSGYKIPFIHPENIFMVDGEMSCIHFGIKDAIAPDSTDNSVFLSQYKSLVLSVLNPKFTYDNFVGGEKSLKDKQSQIIANAESVDEIHQILEQQEVFERKREAVKHVKVPKFRYRFFKYGILLTSVVAISTSIFVVQDKLNTIPKQDAIITAQTDFMTKHYDKTLTDLQNYQPDQLSKAVRFVLAASSVNLADLTPSQKQAILNTISISTDDNTLNYWIYQGRGQFEKALDLAKNIGDSQLTLLAYTDLYQATKLNNVMNGDEKQKKLEEYDKQIQTLSKSLGEQ